MPVSHHLWIVGESPSQVKSDTLADEKSLEDMIVAEPGILSEEWMLIGRQEDTRLGGRVDLLAIAPDASLVLIELKRDKTTRDVIAQTLDYASWLVDLEADDIAAIYGRFKPKASLREDFRDRFGHDLDEDTINDAHQLVVVASSTDPRTERIIRYLESRDIPINLLSFKVFRHGETQLLSRSWLLDPIEVQITASGTSRSEKEPWNGEYYASFGHGDDRFWEEARKYGFISAGGGSWYSNTLKQLPKGARIWVKVPQQGFVGVGRVTGSRQSSTDFQINDRPALDVLKADYHRRFGDDMERMEYFVPVQWLNTVPIKKAVQEVGMFGNQNTVCKPTTPKWRTTIERLKALFSGYDDGKRELE